MLRMSQFALATVAMLTLTAAAWAQQEQRAPQAGTGGQVQQAGGQQAGGQQSSEQYLNNVLGTCVLLANQKEIALLQYGMQKAQNQQVKQFAQQALKEHQQYVQKLQQQGRVQAMVQLREMNLAQGGQPGTQTDTGVRQVEAREGTQGTSEAWAKRMLQIRQEVCQQCLQNARKELDQKQGAEFDKAFVGMQLAAHMSMLDELQVLQRHATGELRTLLQEGQRATEQHLSHLKGLMGQLERGGQSGQGGQNRQGGTDR